MVLDNAAIHHVDGIVDLIESTGALAVFLPPYSPDLNPIEEVLSKLKQTVIANEEFFTILDVESLVLRACTSNTAENWCWIRILLFATAGSVHKLMVQ